MKPVRIFIICLMLSFLATGKAYPEITADEALSEFVAAGIAYKEGRYDAAIERYKSIIEGGRVSGATYYNLGNAYFKKRKFGGAILNYERAQKLIPRDSDLNFNLEHVRARIDQYSSEKSQNFIEKGIRSFVKYYTVDEMILVITGIVILIGIIYLAGLYIRWPRSQVNGMIMALMFVILVFTAGLSEKVNYDRNLAIVMGKTDSYFEPRNNSTVHFKLSEGMKVRILKSELHWIKVERLDGKAGWIDRESLERI